MVNPRLPILSHLAGSLGRTERTLSGLVQRGRVVNVHEDYYPALLDIDLYLRLGKTARINRVQLVGDFHTIPSSHIGAVLLHKDVLLLCPSGRPAEEAYVVGIVSVPNIP